MTKFWEKNFYLSFFLLFTGKSQRETHREVLMGLRHSSAEKMMTDVEVGDIYSGQEWQQVNRIMKEK